jgi:hypothetical protein
MTDKKPTADEIKQMIQADKTEREAACLAEVQAALEKYNCTLVPVFFARGNDIKQTLEIQAS